MVLIVLAGISANAQSFEIITKDTINMTDANGKKKSKWVIRGRNNPKAGYQPEQKMSEGKYLEKKKKHIWVYYFTKGKIKKQNNFKNSRLKGPTSLYFQDGNVKEEGNWMFNRWVGNYKSTLENGDVIEIVFDDTGKEISKKITPAKKTVPSKKK